jgi:ubiquinone/menaquinone biosynthesis C-methylase UbiE
MAIKIMDARDQKRLEFFEDSAEGWEKRHYNPELTERVRTLIQFLKLPATKTALDVACGRGVLIPHLREALGPEARIIALDASAAMLKGVMEKDQRVQIIQARAESIPLPEGYVDLLICFSAFPHLHDKDAAAAEFYRVLSPGGRVYILHLCDRKTINRHHDGHPAVQGDHIPTPEAMHEMFAKVGFSNISLSDDPEHYLFSAQKSLQLD